MREKELLNLIKKKGFKLYPKVDLTLKDSELKDIKFIVKNYLLEKFIKDEITFEEFKKRFAKIDNFSKMLFSQTRMKEI